MYNRKEAEGLDSHLIGLLRVLQVKSCWLRSCLEMQFEMEFQERIDDKSGVT